MGKQLAYVVTLAVQVVLLAGAVAVYSSGISASSMSWLHSLSYDGGIAVAIFAIVVNAGMIIIGIKAFDSKTPFVKLIELVTLMFTILFAAFAFTQAGTPSEAYELALPLLSVCLILQLTKNAFAMSDEAEPKAQAQAASPVASNVAEDSHPQPVAA